MSEVNEIYEGKLESVFPCNIAPAEGPVENFSYEVKSHVGAVIKTAKPKVLIPAFPGTNCEYDSARAMMDAGAEADIAVIRNLTAADVQRSVEDFAKRAAQAQIIALRLKLGKNEEGTKVQLRLWKSRGFITFSEETGLYSKTEAYLNRRK